MCCVGDEASSSINVKRFRTQILFALKSKEPVRQITIRREVPKLVRFIPGSFVLIQMKAPLWARRYYMQRSTTERAYEETERQQAKQQRHARTRYRDVLLKLIRVFKILMIEMDCSADRMARHCLSYLHHFIQTHTHRHTQRGWERERVENIELNSESGSSFNANVPTIIDSSTLGY